MCHCQSHSCGSSSGSCGCQSKSCSCSCHKQQSNQCQSCGCGGSAQSCGCGCKSCGNYADKFLHLADHAWMEVLKEKIKEHIQSHSEHLDELASLISEANHERWKKKLEDKQCCGSYEEKLQAFFGQTCGVNTCGTNKKSQSQQGNQSNKQR